MAKIKDFFIFQPKSKVPAKNGKDTGFYPFYTSSSIQKKFIDEFNYDGDSIILGTGGWPSVHFQNKKFAVSSDCIVLKSEKYSAKLLYYYLYGNIHILKKGFQGARLEHISKKYIENIEIPNIDIRIQNEITYTLDKIQSLINKRKKTIDLIDEIIKSGKFSPMRRSKIKNKYDNYIKKLDEILEIKREFQIKLRGLLSFRKPECAEFVKRLNNSNKFFNLRL